VRVGVVSDIHSNIVALEAVLADMGEVDALWCMGDFVGYGPCPNECVALLREYGVVAIAGNHDLAVIGAISTRDFNPDAAKATAWTAEQLTEEHRCYLESLPPILETEGVTFAHGSPREPIWEYVLNTATAAVNFLAYDTQLCLIGHSHIPTLFLEGDGDSNHDPSLEWLSAGVRNAFLWDPRLGVGGAYMPDGSAATLTNYRFIVNPGSVGQPRDRDPRAAYLVLNTELWLAEWHRVEYDVESVQAHMRELKLPAFLAERLSRGV
jgi:diadenosine tetraphosphatase ApaH/serine/threonine PP2A family protein phosphatase